MIKNQKHKQCLVCTSEQIQPFSKYYEANGLVKCKNCGFIFMERIPTTDELNSHYKKYSYSSEGYLSPITIKGYHKLLDQFEKFRESNKILDVGCGRGWFLQEAKKRNWDVYGTEYSQEAVRICEESGINMISGKLNSESFPTGKFDIITSFEVIEHINDPNDDLSNIYKFLKKGGLFYCTTPNFNSLLRYFLKQAYNIIQYPEHLSYYTPKTLNRVLRINGFKVQKVRTTGISISRIKTSKKISKELMISKNSSDERLRQKISKNWYLQLAKDLINSFLSLFGIGMALKGYYIKK